MVNPYKEKLLDPRWQKKRLLIFNRDKFTCQLCGDNKNTLHVHHKKYYGEPWDVGNLDLITLCCHCHLLIEILPENYFPLKVDKNIKAQNEIHFKCFHKDEREAFVAFMSLINNELYLFPFMNHESVLKMGSILKELQHGK